ncbi:unnamed protein product [Acanthoscelides obtectus]|uniref:Uncharacterized protein n=1 Tax=Acanthoscelides obtectus TaxID=200917 RepID=A0A9P0PC39_ACAOB|nr:unnamed protein product [Acanthoscelides obtectus]CAK1631872.1 hypothetical protein AOBTE_LOCUS7216 [Acanthoscelides obtectus]
MSGQMKDRYDVCARDNDYYQAVQPPTEERPFTKAATILERPLRSSEDDDQCRRLLNWEPVPSQSRQSYSTSDRLLLPKVMRKQAPTAFKQKTLNNIEQKLGIKESQQKMVEIENK